MSSQSMRSHIFSDKSILKYYDQIKKRQTEIELMKIFSTIIRCHIFNQ